jgi:DNA polymerase III delta subunit
MGRLTSLAESVSLFSGTQVYLVDTPSTDDRFFAEVINEAQILQGSPHYFIVIENSLVAADKKILAKVATTIEEFKAGTVERFNMFALADALVRKDRKTLWMLLQEALREGAQAEEIIGILWWQLKMLRLAAKTKTAAEAGVKDFPYNKAKRALAGFKSGEVDTLARSLLALYHDGHAGKRYINVALEEWVLRM